MTVFLKHYLLLTGLVLFFLARSYSQSGNAPVNWGGEIFKPSSSTAFRVIGNWDEGVLMQTRTSSKLFSAGKTFIQRFDNMTMLPQFNKEVVLETTKGSKTLDYQVLERLGGNPVLFATYFNKDKDKIELYGRRYDLEGEPVNKEKKIAEFNATRKSQLEKLNFVQSVDSNLMLAFYSERFDKYENEKIDFTLFNQELDTLWSRNIEFPYKGKNFNIHRSLVDSEGRVFLLIKIQNEKPQDRIGQEFRYSVVTFGPDTSLIEDYEINLDDKFISDIDFSLNDSHNVICSGFYSEEGAGGVSGTFYLKVDRATRMVTGKTLTAFDRDFALGFMEGRRLRGRPELTDFKLDHFITFTDGTHALIAEQFLIDEVCYQDFRTGMISCNYLYYFNNIIVVKMDGEGQVQWTADIPKYQESTNDGGFYSSYVFGQSGNNLYFVFNDNEKNQSEKDKSKVNPMTNLRKAVPVMAKITSEGRFTRRSLGTDNKKGRFTFAPGYSTQLSSGSILLLGETSNKYRVGIVGLD